MNLKKLEQQSTEIILDAYSELKNPALLWSAGCNSTVLLWLVHKAFNGKIPFPVITIETGFEFKEVNNYRLRLAKSLKVELLIAKNERAKSLHIHPNKGKEFCCMHLKLIALKMLLKIHAFDSIYVVMKNEPQGNLIADRLHLAFNGASSIWSYVDSPIPMNNQLDKALLDQARINPLLHWQEIDVWFYILQEDIPLNPLYFSYNGIRYHNPDCEPCAVPISSPAKTITEIVEELETAKI